MADVVVFDGACGLCTRSVQFVLEHEAAPSLMFASAQSPAGVRLLRQAGLDPGDLTTVLLVSAGTLYVRSEAAVRIARHLRLPWRLAAAARIVPRGLRDWAYDLVARNRHRWFGRDEACVLRSQDHASRFLDQ